FIEFETPYVIKHVVHVGLERDENSLLSTTGFNQFQKPLDKDGYIHDKSKWQEFGEETIGDLLNKLNYIFSSAHHSYVVDFTITLIAHVLNNKSELNTLIFLKFI